MEVPSASQNTVTGEGAAASPAEADPAAAEDEGWPPFPVGHYCEAVFEEDGFFYVAVIQDWLSSVSAHNAHTQRTHTHTHTHARTHNRFFTIEGSNKTCLLQGECSVVFTESICSGEHQVCDVSQLQELPKQPIFSTGTKVFVPNEVSNCAPSLLLPGAQTYHIFGCCYRTKVAS